MALVSVAREWVAVAGEAVDVRSKFLIANNFSQPIIVIGWDFFYMFVALICLE